MSDIILDLDSVYWLDPNDYQKPGARIMDSKTEVVGTLSKSYPTVVWVRVPIETIKESARAQSSAPGKHPGYDDMFTYHIASLTPKYESATHVLCPFTVPALNSGSTGDGKHSLFRDLLLRFRLRRKAEDMGRYLLIQLALVDSTGWTIGTI